MLPLPCSDRLKLSPGGLRQYQVIRLVAPLLELDTGLSEDRQEGMFLPEVLLGSAFLFDGADLSWGVEFLQLPFAEIAGIEADAAAHRGED